MVTAANRRKWELHVWTANYFFHCIALVGIESSLSGIGTHLVIELLLLLPLLVQVGFRIYQSVEIIPQLHR